MDSRSPLVSACHPKKRKMGITVVFLAIIIGSVLLAYKAFGDKPKDISTQKVFIIFRHGDRTPTETYPKDPHINHTWEGGWGTLTKRGMLQMYGLGEWLKGEFGYLTNNKYVAANTVINSSYSDRCIESAQSFLAGFFKPREEDSFAKGFPWRPIAVHYVPKDQDKILVVKKPCPKLDAALKEAYLNESIKSGAELESYYKELSRITGQEMTNITDIEFLYNTLEIEVMNGLKLPDELEPYYDEKMREIAARSYTLFTSNTIQQRLRGGPLLQDILYHMNNVNGKKKIFLYATHDVNIVNTLRAMGFTKELFKLELGVTLVFELRTTNGGQSQEVRISMIESADSRSFKPLNVPGCVSNLCKLNDLPRIWKDVLPEDWESECQL